MTMRQLTVGKRIEFEAGHRQLPTFPGKCNNLHGHNWVVEVEITAEADSLDQYGMLIEFSELKALFKGWIDQHIDHATILWAGDPLLAPLQIAGQRVYVMPEGMTPSCEHLALLLRGIFDDLLTKSGKWPLAKLTKLRLYENTNSWAEV